MVFFKVLDYAKHLVSSVLEPGDWVVDATAGNGSDTLFLAELVGEHGKVFAFDIQKDALARTREKLTENKLLERVELICDSHENVGHYVDPGIKAVKFNLGYLPGGEHDITTEANCTLQAVNRSLELLKRGGIVTIVLYPGHPEGKKEKELITRELGFVPQQEYSVLSYRFINQVHHPPELLAVYRL